MQYHQLLTRLLSVNLHGGIKLGLTNCLKMNTALDFPTQKFPAIHVAGTNGKGSVVSKIASALQANGLKVGLYTSPHIACFRERICINGEMISEEDVGKLLSHLFQLTEELKIPATFFELTTLMAFDYFAKKNIDIAVIETGLGGRLDATNIVNSILTIITSISLEHTEVLGSTVEEIAKEKAGIIKPSIPLVIGPRVPREIIEKIAALNSSPVLAVKGFFEDFQKENAAIAELALNHLQIPAAAIETGLRAVPPCRLQTWPSNELSIQFPNLPMPRAVILDVAHNPDGFLHLISSLKKNFSGCNIRYVVGLSKNKDISTCLRLLMSSASHFHLVEAQMERAAPKELLSAELVALGFPEAGISIEISISEAILHAIRTSGANQNEIVVVCGTFFIMAEARKTLGMQEEQDFSNLNEREHKCTAMNITTRTDENSGYMS